MNKKDKINSIRELAGKDKETPLTAEERIFLKSRKVDLNLFHKQPLIIFPGDSEVTAEIIKALALKLDLPVIRIIHKVTGLKIKGDKVIKLTKEVESIGIIPPVYKDSQPCKELNKVIEKQPLPIKDIEEPEPEEAGIKSGTYKLSFPSIFDDDDDI